MDRDAQKLEWLRKATGLGANFPDIYNTPGFVPNGAGPARVFWGIPCWRLVPDWWPLTVAWRDRWKLTACADFHDWMYHLGAGSQWTRKGADNAYYCVLLYARAEIAGSGWLSRLRRYRMAIMAKVYYLAVRAGGKSSYRR